MPRSWEGRSGHSSQSRTRRNWVSYSGAWVRNHSTIRSNCFPRRYPSGSSAPSNDSSGLFCGQDSATRTRRSAAVATLAMCPPMTCSRPGGGQARRGCIRRAPHGTWRYRSRWPRRSDRGRVVFGPATRLTYTEQGVHLDGLDTVEGREEGTRGLLDNLGSFLVDGH
jgi:hypothetical protein